MDNVCRLCLSVQPSNDQINVIHNHVLEKLQSCFRIQISPAKAMPSHICANCSDFIEKANNFRNTVIINVEKLLEMLEKGEETQQFKLNEIKYDGHVSSDNISVLENKKYIICEDKMKAKDDLLNSFDDNSVPYNVNIDVNPLLNNMDKEDLPKTDPRQLTFKCLTCFENYESITVLRRHYFNIHLSKDRKKCTLYSIVTKDDGVNIFKCDVCEQPCGTKKRYVVKHLRSHDEDSPLLCKVCGRTFKTISKIIRHGRVHNERILICSFECGFTTTHFGALKLHEQGHIKEYKYKCKKCNCDFNAKTWDLQQQNPHTGVKPFLCDSCELSFYMNRYMQLTKKCLHCSLPCTCKYEMKRNLKEHVIISRFACDICGKNLSSAFQLRAHKNTHGDVKPNSESSLVERFKNMNLRYRRKRYPRKSCNIQIYKEAVVEESHFKEHVIISRFACDICGKNLSSAFQLRAHKNTHADVKPNSESSLVERFKNMNLRYRRKRYPRKSCNIQIYKEAVVEESHFKGTFSSK